jgi:hypothetical protein
MSGRVDQLNVVVTCSARKSMPALPGLSIRDLAPGDLSSRLAQWMNRLEASAEHNRISAASLYRGDHWATVRRLISDGYHSVPSVKVWIASAGCGLLSPGALIPPYAATFSQNEADSVAETREQRRLWWSALGAMRFEVGSPRSLKELVNASPSAALVVAASPEYLYAMSEDLEHAAALLSYPETLTVLCREGVRLGALDSAKVHLSAELSCALGGALTSLNVRMVRWLVHHLGRSFKRSAVQDAINELHSVCTPRDRIVRNKSTDDQILSFVRDLLMRDSGASGSSALASFRKSGMAAEQRRFRDLFRAARQEVLIG